MEHSVELISCTSGDWKVLKLNGNVFAEGHSITNHDWINLIQTLTNIKVDIQEISDDDMEQGNY